MGGGLGGDFKWVKDLNMFRKRNTKRKFFYACVKEILLG